MNNDDLREDEEQEKSLLKDMSKGISKKLKTMPLEKKILFIGIISSIVFFLLIFTVLASVLMMILNEDYSKNNGSSGLSYINSSSEDNYWWPIGSSTTETIDGKEYAKGEPTSLIITSTFSPNRIINGKSEAHNGIDIGGRGGTNYIIASSTGTVYYVGTGCDNNGNIDNNNCNGGFGNYVVIEHPGSVYTIYAHLYPNSITVKKGEIVKQGQIIGIMGNSGRSTGTHLHFQIEVGGRSSTYAVDPLEYVSTSNPRPKTVESGSGQSQLLKMLQSWEGTGPTESIYYIVYDDGYGNLTVGHGITLKYYSERLKENGANANSLVKGGKIEKTIVDKVELEIVIENKTSIISMLEKNNITLEEYQIDALVIRKYNVGNVDSFPKNYKLYGNTQALYDNYMNKPVISKGEYSVGLDRRRQAEWNLFHNGIYTFNS